MLLVTHFFLAIIYIPHIFLSIPNQYKIPQLVIIASNIALNSTCQYSLTEGTKALSAYTTFFIYVYQYSNII